MTWLWRRLALVLITILIPQLTFMLFVPREAQVWALIAFALGWLSLTVSLAVSARVQWKPGWQ